MIKREIMNVLSYITILGLIVFIFTFILYGDKDSVLAQFSFLNNDISIKTIFGNKFLAENYPVEDEEGLKGTPYVFSINNSKNKKVKYQLIFVNNDEEIEKAGYQKLDNKYLRYSLEKENNDYTVPKSIPEDGIIYESIINKKTKEEFKLYVWLDINSDSNVQNKMYNGVLIINEIK